LMKAGLLVLLLCGSLCGQARAASLERAVNALQHDAPPVPYNCSAPDEGALELFGQYSAMYIVGLVFLHSVLLARVRWGKGPEERAHVVTMYITISRFIINSFGVVAQIYYLSWMAANGLTKTPPDGNVILLIATVGLTSTIYAVELLAREGLSLTVILHHIAALIAYMIAYGRPSGISQAYHSFGILPTAHVGHAMVNMTAVVGLFATSAFGTDFTMLFYHTVKDSSPLLVYNLLRGTVVYTLVSKVAIHTLFIWLLVKSVAELGTMSGVLLACAGAFWMACEYQLAYVLYKITASHHRKRVVPLLAKKEEPLLPATVSAANQMSRASRFERTFAMSEIDSGEAEDYDSMARDSM